LAYITLNSDSVHEACVYVYLIIKESGLKFPVRLKGVSKRRKSITTRRMFISISIAHLNPARDLKFPLHLKGFLKRRKSITTRRMFISISIAHPELAQGSLGVWS
jgi:hypothetical protein